MSDAIATVICLIAAGEGAPKPPALPEGCIGVVLGAASAPRGWQAIAGSLGEGLAEVTRRFPAHDRVLLAADAVLPAHWWDRLGAAIRQAESFDVISALGPRPGGMDPWADATLADADTGARDRACWLHAEHTLYETHLIGGGLSWWRAGTALPTRLPAGPSDGLRCALAPFLYVGQPGPPESGPLLPPIAGLAARIAHADSAGTGLPGADRRPVILHVLHGWGGGVWQFVRSLMRHDPAHHHLALLSLGDPQRHEHGQRLALHLDLDRAPIGQWTLPDPILDTALRSPAWQQVFDRIATRYGVSGVLVSSLIGHSLDALRSPLPTVLCTHDAYPLWPFLADDGEQTGDGSESALRARYTRGTPPLFPSSSADRWLRLRAAWLEAVQTHHPSLVAPSASTRDRLIRLAPSLRTVDWSVIGHAGPDWPARATEAKAKHSADAPLRVLVPGRINGGKGETLLRALFARAPAGVEFMLLGAGASGMQFFGLPRVHVRLEYTHAELPALIEQLHPDLALLPSVVDETWSYTLSEMWRLGIPVMATQRGSYAERITDGRDGLLVPAQPDAIADRLGALVRDRTSLGRLQPGPIPELSDWLAAWNALLPATAHAATITSGVDIGALMHDQHCVDRAATNVDLTRARAETAETRDELQRRTDWALRLEAEGVQLRDDLVQSRLTSEAALAAESEAHARTRERLDASGNALRTTTEAYDQARKSLEDATKALALAESTRRELDAELGQTQATLDDAHRLYQRDTDDLARQRDVALDQRDQLQREIATLLHSHSWRVTRPLRGLRRTAATLTASLTYRWRAALALWRRGIASLRSRGVRTTWEKVHAHLLRAPAPSVTPILAGTIAASAPEALPTSDTPLVSIIIPVYNHCQTTLACLAALGADTPRAAFEVIVVDDASTDETAQRLPAVHGLRYLRNPQNLGFIGACNAGAAQALGRWLVFLNNDTQPRPGWLDALLDSFTRLPDAGIVGAKLIYPDGRLQEAGGIVFSDGSGWNYGRFEQPDDPRFNFVREVDYCSGAAIAISRELFQQLHGFDPHFAPAYYEDTDLAMRVRAQGKRVYYQPAAEVIHFEGVTSGTDLSKGVKAHQVENQVRFLARWRQTLWRTHALPGSDPAAAAARGRRQPVLVVDACTPTPDRDSGSVRMLNLLRLLIDRGHAVSFVAQNLAHDGQYTRALQQLGVEVWWHPWINDPARWMAIHGRRFEHVILSRHYVASAWLPLVRQFAPHARVMFDTVDLHYLREQREAELVADPARLRAAADTRERELRMVRDCDLTLVVSPVEQALLAREAPGAQVEVLSNVHEIAGCRNGFTQREGLLFVGGYRHPPNVDAALWFCRNIWPLVRAALPELELNLVGSSAPPQVVALGELAGVRFHGHVPDLAPYLDGCRLAIAPLRYGAGVKGKVNQSMAHGQPVVATSCAAEGMYLRHGHDVLIADEPKAFADAIIELYGDESRWVNLSHNGLCNVREHYSLQSAAQVLDRIFGAAGRRHVA